MSKETEFGTVEEGKSKTQEVTRKNKRDANVPHSGVYRHPESGQEAIVQGDPLWGNTQAQAFARLGFVFVREAREGEIKTLPELAADTRKEQEGTMKGISARLDALEGVAEENKTLQNEVADLRKKLAEAEAAKKEEVKSEKAEQKTAKATSDHVSEAGASQVSDAQEKSAEGAKQNAEEETKKREQASGNTNTKVTNKEGK